MPANGLIYTWLHNPTNAAKEIPAPAQRDTVRRHDIERVCYVVSPEYLQEFRNRWNEGVSGGTGGTLRKMVALDGKTQGSNRRAG